jgi:hypothetical protein
VVSNIAVTLDLRVVNALLIGTTVSVALWVAHTLMGGRACGAGGVGRWRIDEFDGLEDGKDFTTGRCCFYRADAARGSSAKYLWTVSLDQAVLKEAWPGVFIARDRIVRGGGTRPIFPAEFENMEMLARLKGHAVVCRPYPLSVYLLDVQLNINLILGCTRITCDWETPIGTRIMG